MRHLLVICALLAASVAPATAQRKVAERFAVAPNAHVSILNVAGSVKVTGWEHDSIAIGGTVHETAPQQFIVKRADNGIKIGIWDPAVEKMPPSHLDIRVPSGAQVWVRTGSSTVFVGGVRGGIDVNSVGGSIELAGSPREAFAESMTGTIVLDVNTPLARAKTVTAPIRVHGRIGSLTATSVGGSILIENADVERAACETVDGELRWVGPLSPRAGIGFITHQGAVEFLLPAATAASFTVSTYEGEFVNEFKAPVQTTRSKVKGSQHVFTVGSSDAEVDVRTFRGRVVFRTR